MLLICLDTETTGLTAGYDEVLQLSVIDGDGNVLLDEYFRPVQRKSWPDAQRVNHISPESVSEKPPILEYRERIEKILNSADLIVGYNLTFDLKMLEGVGIRVPEKPEYDVMLEFAPIYGEEMGAPFFDYKWQKLVRCAAFYGYRWPDEGARGSLSNAGAVLYCYRRMTEDK